MQKQTQKKLWWLMLFPISFMVMTIILNSFMREPLYLMGEQAIISLQQGSNIVFDYFFLLITMVIDPTIIVALVILILLMSKNKEKAIVIFIFILFNAFLAATLKAIYKDPRPIWTDEQIKNIGIYCPVEYGNPSGHSWFSIILGFGVLLQYKSIGHNYMNLWISIALGFFVPFSRMYLGAHSLNQVLQGVIFGLAMSILFCLDLRDQILDFLWTFTKNRKWQIFIGLCHVAYIIPFVIGLNYDLPDEWEQNIKLKCDIVMNEGELNFLMFTANGIFINAITGIAIAYRYLLEQEGGQSYLLGKWLINEQKYEITKGKILYIIIQGLFLATAIVIGGLLAWYFMKYKALVFIFLNVGAFLSGFIFIAYTSKVLYKLRIIREIQHILF